MKLLLIFLVAEALLQVESKCETKFTNAHVGHIQENCKHKRAIEVSSNPLFRIRTSPLYKDYTIQELPKEHIPYNFQGAYLTQIIREKPFKRGHQLQMQKLPLITRKHIWKNVEYKKPFSEREQLLVHQNLPSVFRPTYFLGGYLLETIKETPFKPGHQLTMQKLPEVNVPYNFQGSRFIGVVDPIFFNKNRTLLGRTDVF